ncbi:FBP domain-containing protein [Paramicrobacterium chengjingii]|uniref:FBP domain-containing protein n=1 Tax=Paramicrobacterium chengjingii TaxID=2769067 RepID=A0ABX6YJU2_9MICO|nr:FBP domain-containing protein [Microbacterium chengjingii]QPZ38625.1 FBP domain-containing protein [Microbacterium chengjingii]
MHSITEKQIRSSFINASKRERTALTLPENVDSLDWDSLDFLGWRDRKFPKLGYVVALIDDEPIGIMLRLAEGRTLSRPQCSWCEDVHLPNDVVFFVAKRAGDAGRKGDTIGTLSCANFECNANVRRLPRTAYVGFDVEGARLQRIEALRSNVTRFVTSVRDGS